MWRNCRILNRFLNYLWRYGILRWSSDLLTASNRLKEVLMTHQRASNILYSYLQPSEGTVVILQFSKLPQMSLQTCERNWLTPYIASNHSQPWERLIVTVLSNQEPCVGLGLTWPPSPNLRLQSSKLSAAIKTIGDHVDEIMYPAQMTLSTRCIQDSDCKYSEHEHWATNIYTCSYSYSILSWATVNGRSWATVKGRSWVTVNGRSWAAVNGRSWATVNGRSWATVNGRSWATIICSYSWFNDLGHEQPLSVVKVTSNILIISNR